MVTLFLKTWGALIVATIALIQPWFVAFWKKYIRRGEVDIFETGQIDVGFSQLGPTIGLHGTLRARHRDLFISRIDLLVIRKSDSARHRFDWSFFCGYQGTLSNYQDATIELASGFLLRCASPYRYRIIFSDVNTQTEINTMLSSYKIAWNSKRADALRAHPHDQDQEMASSQGQGVLLHDTYQEFRSSTEHVNAFTDTGKAFYWKAGEYTLEMTVHTEDAKNPFSKTWSFHLTREESESLELNIIPILQTTCLGDIPYLNIVYPKYQEPK